MKFTRSELSSLNTREHNNKLMRMLLDRVEELENYTDGLCADNGTNTTVNSYLLTLYETANNAVKFINRS